MNKTPARPELFSPEARSIFKGGMLVVNALLFVSLLFLLYSEATTGMAARSLFTYAGTARELSLAVLFETLIGSLHMQELVHRKSRG